MYYSPQFGFWVRGGWEGRSGPGGWEKEEFFSAKMGGRGEGRRTGKRGKGEKKRGEKKGKRGRTEEHGGEQEESKKKAEEEGGKENRQGVGKDRKRKG
ncbi:MAG TPA: hypothetical protein DCP78_02995, partial [Sphingobacterium sp.]|nr:hypothetical protein [Sphingobacterium sp.]